MMRKYTIAIIVAFWTLPAAAALVIDGDLSDWGVHVADDNQSTFNFAANLGLLGSHIDDQCDWAGDSGYLGPHYGGQKFDAEMMAVALKNGNFYIAIVSGQRPDNGLARYNPGDLIIETTAGIFGLEIGGGPGGGTGTTLVSGDSGSTYTMNKNGYTTAHAFSDPRQTAGSIWGNVDWLLNPISPKVPVQFQINNDSILVGHADYVFTRDTGTTQHSIMELSFPAAWFAGNPIESFTWRPSCGNDAVQVILPEPASLGLLLVGTAVLLRANRRRAVVN